jgi:hypothetical protein
MFIEGRRKEDDFYLILLKMNIGLYIIYEFIYNLQQGVNSMALLGSCRPAGLAFCDHEWMEIKSRKVGLGITWLGKQQGATFGHQSKKKE